MRGLIVGLVLAVSLSAQEIRLTRIATGVDAPTDIQDPGDGSGRIFFVQQNGLVRIFRNGALLPQPFLDLRTRTRGGEERGLLGLAFPPGFAQKQRFYVDYTNLNGDTIIAQFRVSSNPDVADPAGETVLLNIRQPFANHNGGQLRFGPDGFLYIAMGDGGSGGDPMNNGQRLDTLLGKILRIDVESNPGTVAIPPANPFANRPGARGEIWAYGLRNPWRFSFDRATGDLWIADVGQNVYEEVNFQPASSPGGENYGWNRMEGMHCYLSGCSPDRLSLPVAEYSHAEGCSVTGGFVYRGRRSPGLRGIYLYADYCSGRIWGLERQGAGFVGRLLLNSGFAVTTFGEDSEGELYLAHQGQGAIYRIEGATAPRFNSDGVVNAASFAPGLPPGSLATVFAFGVLDQPGVVAADRIPLPLSLAGVSVTVGGIAAPILAVSNSGGTEQINFQVPFEMMGRPSAAVAVARADAGATSVNVPVRDIQPAIYSSDGLQAIVVHNADFGLVSASRPLQRNEFAFVYAAGLGGVASQPATGAGAPDSAPALANVTLTLGGMPCEIQYAGLAPQLVGVYQVNFRVPGNAVAGPQDLLLSANGMAGPPLKVAVE